MSHKNILKKFLLNLICLICILLTLQPLLAESALATQEIAADGTPAEVPEVMPTKEAPLWFWYLGLTQRFTTSPLNMTGLLASARQTRKADYALEAENLEIRSWPVDFFVGCVRKRFFLPNIEMSGYLSVQLMNWQTGRNYTSNSTFKWPSAPHATLTQFQINLQNEIIWQQQSYLFMLQSAYTLPWSQTISGATLQHALGTGLGGRYTMIEAHYRYHGRHTSTTAGSYSGAYSIRGDGSYQEADAWHFAATLYYQATLAYALWNYVLRLGFEYNTRIPLTSPQTSFVLQGTNREILYRSQNTDTHKTEYFNFSNLYISLGTQTPF